MVSTPARCRARTARHSYTGRHSKCRHYPQIVAWSRQRLAKESGVPYGTLSDFEGGRRRMFSTSLAKIARALDKAGVELLYDGQDGKGAGVRFKVPQAD